MWTRRLVETLAITIIGDGVIQVVAPRGHALLWETGPEGFRKVARFFADNPDHMRLLGAAQTVFGVWLALRQHHEG